jgi:integrase
MPYVQAWKGSFRFRRRVPDHLVGLIGKREWVQALGTKNRAEANRLVIPHIERTNEDIRDAEQGNWPRIGDERLSDIAGQWWQWHLEERAKWLGLSVGLVADSIDGHRIALTGEGELGASLTRFINERELEVRPNSSAFARLKHECRILHHERTDGYYGEIDARRKATVKILDAIENLEVEPQQVAAFIEGKPIHSTAGKVAVRPYKWPDLIADWARETKAKEKTRYGWTKIINKLIAHIGHDDAVAVTEADLIGWKDKLVSSGLSSTTIKNHLTVLRTLYNFARDNKRIPVSLAAGVKYRAKPDPRRKRRGYNEEDARRILKAARRENEAQLRWVPWIEALTGARLDEICGANVADIYEFGGVWCLDIRLDYRGDDGSLKTAGSERKVPLHPALIAEGFLEYVRSLRKDGPLFPRITPDRFGSRAGNGSKTIGRWIRERVGITDPRKAPNHSWRHYFKSICRDFDIEEEYHDALTGHKGEGGEGREYGEYFVRVLYREICKIESPV